jgi:hypothetical protein
LNLGLPEQLKVNFPFINPAVRPTVLDPKIKDPYWLAGFIDAEGSFGIKISKSSSTKSGYNVYLQFNLVQHVRDEILLKSLEEYLNCGKVYRHSANALTFTVTKFSDIQNIIIPFLNKYPLLGAKYKDF